MRWVNVSLLATVIGLVLWTRFVSADDWAFIALAIVIGLNLLLIVSFVAYALFARIQLNRAESALHELNVEQAKKSAVLTATAAVSAWRADGATHAITATNHGLHEATEVVFSVVDAEYRRVAEVTLPALASKATVTVEIDTPRSDSSGGAGRMLPWTLLGQYTDGLRTHRHFLSLIVSSPADSRGTTVASPAPPDLEHVGQPGS
jgi:hypothetical protein